MTVASRTPPNPLAPNKSDVPTDQGNRARQQHFFNKAFVNFHAFAKSDYRSHHNSECLNCLRLLPHSQCSPTPEWKRGKDKGYHCTYKPESTSSRNSNTSFYDPHKSSKKASAFKASEAIANLFRRLCVFNRIKISCFSTFW